MGDGEVVDAGVAVVEGDRMDPVVLIDATME